MYRDLVAVHYHTGVLHFIKAVPLHGGLNIISVQGTHAMLSVSLPGELLDNAEALRKSEILTLIYPATVKLAR